MDIQRKIMAQLLRWKGEADRKPLIIHGARQIGKTWVMRKFGELHYKHVAYFNFDSNEDLAKEFEKTKDPKRLIRNLGAYSDDPIIPGDTLIIFDEIQECGRALNSLKYFYEEAPEYHIISAGSLLGVALLREEGFPVGKVDFITMYPLSFSEYFNAYDQKSCRILENCEHITDLQELPSIVWTRMWEAYRQYQICGGMPKAAVASLLGEGNAKVDQIQKALLTSFYMDFSKHAPVAEFPKIAQVWKSLPSQLAKENRKFLYTVVKPGARAREYESALAWLREAGLIYQIYCCSKPDLPLSAYDELNAFKIYLLDSGLLRVLAEMPAELLLEDNARFVEFKGALAENMVLQQMLTCMEGMPRYWVSQGTAEVDFLIQRGLEIVPIEVKSGSNVSSKSLSVYVKKYMPKMVIIFSHQELNIIKGETTLLKLPLPMAAWLDKFTSEAFYQA